MEGLERGRRLGLAPGQGVPVRSVPARPFTPLRPVVQPRAYEDDGDEDGDDEPEESYEAYEQRINLYVAAHMATASSSKRDAYKDGLVYQTRKDVINDFIKVTMSKKCQNSGCAA